MPFFRRGRCCRLIYLLVALPLVVQAQVPDQQEGDALQRADAAFHAGYAALQAGHLDTAKAEFATAVSLAPQIPEGHEALGAVLVSLGQPAKAIPEFEAALALKPGDQAIESNLAIAYAKSGDPAKAAP